MTIGLVDAQRHQVGLERNPSPDRGLDHSFKWPDLALRAGHLLQNLSNAIRTAQEFDRCLRAEGRQSAEQEHALAGLNTGQQGNDCVVSCERMLWSRVHRGLAGFGMMVDD